MHIKKYTVAALLLILLVGAYVFVYISQDKIALDIFGFMTLPPQPVAVLVIAPLIVLYLATIFHMFYHTIMTTIRLRRYDKDYEKIMDAIAEAYLAKVERNHTYKTGRYKLLGSIIDSATLFPRRGINEDTKNKKLKDVLNLLEDIKNGEVVDLKKYNLKAENTLMIQNDVNRYKKDNLSAELILNHPANYAPSLVDMVYMDTVKTAPLAKIQEHKSLFSLEALYIILERIDAKENTLSITSSVLTSLLDGLKLDANEYIKISTLISTTISPEDRLKLFETIGDTNQNAMEAYLYTLFDLEMLKEAKDFLVNTQPNEYRNFKAYSDLKSSGKNYDINIFLR